MSDFDYLNQIWTDDNYVYAATLGGLNIIDLISAQQYAYATYSGGFNTVWANDMKVYLGTTNSGIKYLQKTCISGSLIEPYELSFYLLDYLEFPLTSNYIKYIHGNNDLLICCTLFGVDVIKFEPNGYRSYTTIFDTYKGFMTSSGKFYYTSVSGLACNLNVVNTCLCDWSAPDKIYNNINFFHNDFIINDLFVTESTSGEHSANTIFMATSSGIYILDESDDSFFIFYKEST